MLGLRQMPAVLDKKQLQQHDCSNFSFFSKTSARLFIPFNEINDNKYTTIFAVSSVP